MKILRLFLFVSVLLSLCGFNSFIYATASGITGRTLKGSSATCSCHTSSSSSSVTLTISGPTTLAVGQVGAYTVVMTYTSNITASGIDIACSSGTLSTTDSKMKVSGSELTHNGGANSSGTTSITYSFNYTAPAAAGTCTLYAIGTAVHSKWNNASNFSVTVSPLPVELVSFDAHMNGNSVQLNWITATEVNNNGFEVERSINSGVWEKAGFIKGAGNSNSSKYYSFNDYNISKAGKYSYRLKQLDVDGSFKYSNTVQVNNSAPMSFSLMQNYPNPFNPSTTISYALPEAGNATLKVYNILGKEVATLVSEYKPAGNYSLQFNGSNLESGVYLYKLESGNYSAVRKFILLK